MNIVEMHNEFVIRSNKIDSLNNKEFSPLERDSFLNEAIVAFVNRSYNGTNAKRLSFEQTQEMLDEIKTLVIHSPVEQPWIPYSEKLDNLYSFDLSTLSYEYLHLISVQAISKDCPDLLKVNMVQYDDLQYYLTNGIVGPSKLWRRLIGVISKNKLIVYSEKGLEVSQIAVSYIKYPDQVSLGGYVDVNGNLVSAKDCDLPKNVHSKIVDLAVLIAQGVLENQMGYQLNQQKLIINS